MRKSITTTAVVVVIMLLYYALVFTEGVGVVLHLQQKGEISKRSCNQNELKALIKLRDSLIDHSNRLSSWFGEDCCSWNGVGCSKGTGNVVELDLHNPVLNYSDSNYTANHDRARLQGEIIPSLLNLKHLRYIDLKGNNFSGMLIPKFFSSLNNLRYLNLSENSFQGPLPTEMGNVSQLTVLDLSYNSFQGPLPTEIGNVSQLTVLDLSWNELEGEMPRTIRNLCNLSVLDLSFNKFNGEVPIFMGNASGCLWNSLKVLRLRFNKFSGFLPNNLGDFKNLEDLRLYSNSFIGSIPLSLGQLSNLEYLVIGDNFLDGSVNELHFLNLTRLNVLYLFEKSLVLDVSPQWVPPFQLQTIYLVSLQLGPQFPPWLQTQRHLESLRLRNTCISDTIPDWFENLYSRIELLDISHNQISGKLPMFRESKINDTRRMLDLSSNKFEGPLISIPSDVSYLDISNNLLSGSIPLIDDNRNMILEYLDLSTNNLSGGFPTYFCKIKTLKTIILSESQLSGELPWCIGDLHQLEVLDLSNNTLHGEIPTYLGSLRSLFSLHLNNNRFHGKIPLSLHNLTNLEHLDLSENEFTDIIPPWIGENPSSLRFLSLQSNKFYGDIPLQLCHLSSLQLINLARNNITGRIPRCFGNFSAMTVDDTKDSNWFVKYDNEYIVAYMKGRELEYTGSLQLLKSIDLSNNHIVGEIPGELMDLIGLKILNLSENYLNGRIHENIGNLKQLESLDLSRNKLSGPIPPTLSALNFLSYLNLSFNNLSGRIPTGNQLQTLNDPSIYMGNNELCGPQPFFKDCPDDTSSEGHEHVRDSTKDEYDSELLAFYVGIGPGFLAGFLGVCGVLHFKKSWRYALFQFVEKTCNNLLVAVAVKTAWLRKKFHRDEMEE